MFVDESLHCAVELLYPGVVPSNLLVVLVLTVRPQCDTVEVLIAGIQHLGCFLAGDELLVLGVLLVVVVLRPDVTHNLLVGVVLLDVGNGGLQVLHPLVHIRRVGIERGIQHVAHLANGEAFIATCFPTLDNLLLRQGGPITTVNIEVGNGNTIVTDVATGQSLLEHIEHGGKALFDAGLITGAIPLLNVEADGVYTGEFQNVNLLVDFCLVQLAVGQQKCLIDKAERRNFILLQVGFAVVVQTIVDYKLLGSAAGAILATTFGYTTGAVWLGVLTSCQSKNHCCDGTEPSEIRKFHGFVVFE